MKIKRSFYVEVPLLELNEDLLNLIKGHLSNQVRDYMTDEIQTVEYFYIDEKNQTISLPPFYPLSYDEEVDLTEKGKPLNESSKLNPDFNYKDGQESDVNDGISQDILSLMKPPGSGKTIIGSCAILKRGVRSLILVDQDNLKQQWLAALELVFKGTIKVSSSIKLDGSKKDLDCDVYVTTIQGIIAKIRKYGLGAVRDFYQEYHIGHVLFDECHVLIGPEKFSEFGHVCNSKYILALSATPKTDIYFQYWLGTTIVGDSNYEVSPTIVEMEFNAKMSYKEKYINWGGKFHKDRHANILFKNDEYMSMILSIAVKCLEKKRQLLIISDYNKFGVDTIYDLLIKYIPEDQIGKFIGGCNKDEISGRPIIVSNYKMLQKGTDIPGLDTLFMAGELGDATGLEQTIGRILRLNKGIKKKQLLVFDMQETSLEGTKWRKAKRFLFYSEKNFNII